MWPSPPWACYRCTHPYCLPNARYPEREERDGEKGMRPRISDEILGRMRLVVVELRLLRLLPQQVLRELLQP